MMRITETVKQLIIINVIFFIGSYIIGRDVASDYLALHSLQSDKFQPWQLITHMFMHGSPMHIFFNMFALFSFGVMLEQFWGAKKFIFFYISCGLGAAALQLGVHYLEIQSILKGAADLNLTQSQIHQILNVKFDNGSQFLGELFQKEIFPTLQQAGKLTLLNEDNFYSLFNAAISNQAPMVGASGAIYGILVAFAFLMPNAELMIMFIPIPIKAKYFVPGLLTLDLFLGLKGQSLLGFGDTGVAHFAHLGGALIGFLMMWYWSRNSNRNRWN